MTHPSFNILEEPWLEVVDPVGGSRDLGLLDTLAKAHTLSGLSDPSPLMECGLYRLLIAFVLDAYWLEDLQGIEELLEAGRFDPARLQTYVEGVGRDHFDLFDAEHPFLQSAPQIGMTDPEDVITRLVQHLPSGTFATHFFHGAEDEHAFAPAVCARALAAIPAFMTSGGAGFSPSVNGSPPWYVFVRGRSLFETIVMNTAPLSLPLFGGKNPAPPAWRRDTPVVPKQDRECGSLLEALTWQPRRVRLIAGEGGVCTYSGISSPVLVRRMAFGYGFRFSGSWTDPQVGYRFTNKGVAFRIRPDEGRELWRDTGPLLLLRKGDFESETTKVRFQRPYVVEQAYQLVRDDLLDPERPFEVEVYGLRTDKMKLFEWQKEHLALPPGVLLNPRAPAQLQTAVEYAQRSEYYLGRALKKAYPRNGAGNDRALRTVIARAKRTFWDELRVFFTVNYLPELAGQEPDDAAAPPELGRHWAERVRRVARSIFDITIDPLDADASALRRQVEARSYLWSVTAPPKKIREQTKEVV